MDDLDLGATIKGFVPGQKAFNRFTLQRILGRGGMGIVWLARDEELEREVALKFLPELVALDREAVRDLKHETRRSLELTHEHIVRIYDFMQDARTAAISMEYIAGSTLASRKLDQPAGFFEVAEIQAWVLQGLNALDYAHRKAGVVHRDLKPANLMVDRRDELRIADFGIAATVTDSVSRVSRQAGTSGTPLYMSPQQMMGDRPAVTDDIYALGATVYELLTGKPPFHSGNVFMQVKEKVPPPMAERRRERGEAGAAIPENWERTIAACLAKESADRPQDARALARLLAGETVPAVVVAPSPPVTVAPVAPAAPAEPAERQTEKSPLAPWQPAPVSRLEHSIVGGAIAVGTLASAVLFARDGEHWRYVTYPILATASIWLLAAHSSWGWAVRLAALALIQAELYVRWSAHDYLDWSEMPGTEGLLLVPPLIYGLLAWWLGPRSHAISLRPVSDLRWTSRLVLGAGVVGLLGYTLWQETYGSEYRSFRFGPEMVCTAVGIFLAARKKVDAWPILIILSLLAVGRNLSEFSRAPAYFGLAACWALLGGGLEGWAWWRWVRFGRREPPARAGGRIWSQAAQRALLPGIAGGFGLGVGAALLAMYGSPHLGYPVLAAIAAAGISSGWALLTCFHVDRLLADVRRGASAPGNETARSAAS